MNCGNCKYGHDVGYALLCWGQRFAPEVRPDDWCNAWKPKNSESGWTPCSYGLPDIWESVQVFIPDEAPMPTVREGYLIDTKGEGIPEAWFIPALRHAFHLSEILAWRNMAEPPTDAEVKEWIKLCSGQ